MKLCFVFKVDMEVIWYFTRDMKSIKMGEKKYRFLVSQLYNCLIISQKYFTLQNGSNNE